jgi:fucose permease
MADNRSQKRLLVFTAYCTVAVLGIYVTLYQYTVLNVSQLYKLNASMMGFLIAIQQIGIAIPPLFVGAAAGRVGKKKIVQTSFALLVIGTFLIGVTNSFIAFIASVFVIGAGFSVTEGTICAILSDEFPEESKRHLNFSQVFFSIGALIGPFIAEALIGSGIYFKDLYFYIAALFAALSVLFFFTRQKSDRPAAAESPSFSLTGFFKSRVLLLFAAGIFLYVGAETTVANFADSYFELSLKAPEMSAAALALFWGAMIPSRFLAGILNVDVKKLFAALSALIIASAVSAMLVPGITVKIILFALCGFFCGPMWPLIMDETAKRNKGASGSSMNIMMACCGFGGAALPLAAGFGVSLGGESIAYYISAAAFGLMLLALMSALKAPKKQDLGA